MLSKLKKKQRIVNGTQEELPNIDTKAFRNIDEEVTATQPNTFADLAVHK
jgi:hypothetical protein